MLPKPPTCIGCPAEHCGQSYVPGRGPLDARLALVGQGPGKVEAVLGEPFRGPSGKLLSRWLERAGLPEELIYIDNVVRCRLVDSNDKDRKPLVSEIKFCMEAHVLPVLRDMPNLRVVVPVGVPAQHPFTLDKPGERNVGTVQVRERGEVLGG